MSPSAILETVYILTPPGARVLYLGACDSQLVDGMRSDGFDAERLDPKASLRLAFPDVRFQTVVVEGRWLDSLDDARLDAALLEIARITGDTIVLDISSASADVDGRLRSRSWWEQRCLVAGLRRHPRLFALVGFEALEDEAPGALIAMQKLPAQALAVYPLASLRDERDLHMDMLREAGRRSDAHLARYEWARQWIQPGDVVVDAACGLGYGSALMWDGTEAARITGLDISDSAVAYARASFVPGRPGVEYRVADVETWDGWADSSVDCIVSFETLEHLVDPNRFIAGVRRVLRPGGRFLCSIPNLWVDETGNDPNPYHLHVFDLERLVETVSKALLVDDAWAQSAGGHGARFDPRRLLRPLGWPSRNAQLEGSAEWWLLVGVREKEIRRIQGDPPYIQRRPRATIRVGVFGTGAAGMKVWEALAAFDEIDVAWFADNNVARQGQRILGRNVIDPATIPSTRFDAVVIGSMSRAPIEAQLRALGVPGERIVTADVEQPVEALRNELARRHVLNLRRHLVRPLTATT